MSKPVLEDLFSFHGRRNRKSYALWALVRELAVLVVIPQQLGIARPFLPPHAVLALFMVLIIPIAVASLAVTTQRLRDFDWSGWWALAVIPLRAIPYGAFLIELPLLLIPGTDGDNRFGPDPRRTFIGGQAQT